MYIHTERENYIHTYIHADIYVCVKLRSHFGSRFWVAPRVAKVAFSAHAKLSHLPSYSLKFSGLASVVPVVVLIPE